MRILDFQLQDIQDVVEVLMLSSQSEMLAVDELDVIRWLHIRLVPVFLIFEGVGQVVGLVHGLYDGFCAMIYSLSVNPTHQCTSLRSQLDRAIVRA